MPELKINLCRINAKMPTYATSGSACFDIYAANDFPLLLCDGRSIVVETGLKMDIPEGYAVMIYSRSGHGFKSDVRLANCTGVIDSDYTGELMVKLTMDSQSLPQLRSMEINSGDRIAQGMLIKVDQVSFVQVEGAPEQKGERTGGFGSTGK